MSDPYFKIMGRVPHPFIGEEKEKTKRVIGEKEKEKGAPFSSFSWVSGSIKEGGGGGGGGKEGGREKRPIRLGPKSVIFFFPLLSLLLQAASQKKTRNLRLI